MHACVSTLHKHISDGAFGGEEENERFAKIMNGERLLGFCLNANNLSEVICIANFFICLFA